jgi:hypothetical protein
MYIRAMYALLAASEAFREKKRKMHSEYITFYWA